MAKQQKNVVEMVDIQSSVYVCYGRQKRAATAWYSHAEDHNRVHSQHKKRTLSNRLPPPPPADFSPKGRSKEGRLGYSFCLGYPFSYTYFYTLARTHARFTSSLHEWHSNALLLSAENTQSGSQIAVGGTQKIKRASLLFPFSFFFFLIRAISFFFFSFSLWYRDKDRK